MSIITLINISHNIKVLTIGKILADNWGITDKLGGTKNFTEVEKLATLSIDKIFELSNAIKNAKGDTIQLQKVLTETFEDGKYSKVNGLEGYIKKNDVLKRESINELITKQNYENIAKQSFSFQGINANIKEYNNLLKSSIKEGFQTLLLIYSHYSSIIRILFRIYFHNYYISKFYLYRLHRRYQTDLLLQLYRHLTVWINWYYCIWGT